MCRSSTARWPSARTRSWNLVRHSWLRTCWRTNALRQSAGGPSPAYSLLCWCSDRRSGRFRTRNDRSGRCAAAAVELAVESEILQTARTDEPFTILGASAGSVAIRISSRGRTLSGVCLRLWATTGSVSILSNFLVAKEPERDRGCAVQLEVGGVVLVVRARTARVCCVPRCERDDDMGGCHRGVARGGGAGS